MWFIAEAVTGTSMFSADMISKIQAALTSAVNNVLGTFVDLLPIMALICGVGFGISFVRGLFAKTRRGR